MPPTNRRSTDSRFSGPLPDRIRHARRLAKLSQVGLADRVGVVPSAVAQWEGRTGTSPTVEHMVRVAKCTGVAFEWLATGRGVTVDSQMESPTIAAESFARDLFEERLLLAFRKIAQKKRERFVVWFEDFV